jgi:prephenate dehydrogenase
MKGRSRRRHRQIGGAMRIGFIGAGKVGTAFGRYLHAKGLIISGYHDHHTDKAAHAGKMTRSRTFEQADDLARASDLLLITTQDDRIAGVCQALAGREAIRPDLLVGHMSGAQEE